MSKITADQIKVMAKLIELGEEDAARDLGHQLVAQAKGQGTVGTDSSPKEKPDFSKMGEKRAAFERAKWEAENKDASMVSLPKMLNALDTVIRNARRHGNPTAIGRRPDQIEFDQARWLVKKSRGLVDWVEDLQGKKRIHVDSANRKLWDFRNNLADQVELDYGYGTDYQDNPGVY